MTAMIDAKGSEYVRRWPGRIADKFRLSEDYVAQALTAVTGAEVDTLRCDGPHPLVAALTPDQARAVVREVETIRDGIDAHQRTHCRGCGLRLVGGQCEECV